MQAGIDGLTFPHWPARQRVAVPASLAGELAVYVGGLQRVVAPRGWRCNVQEAVDGSDVITVEPRGTASQLSISSWSIPACVGCMFDAVCAYFPREATAVSVGLPCECERAGRRKTRLSRTLVRDPQREHGSSLGLVFFEPRGTYQRAAGMSCIARRADLRRGARRLARAQALSGRGASATRFATERGAIAPSRIAPRMSNPLVGILVGSASDRERMQPAFDELDARGIAWEFEVRSAHRDPDAVSEYARSAAGRGMKVLICGAGLAAALPGVVAAQTELPVIGVPLRSSLSVLDGLDALLSIVQMPPGVPVATVGVDNAKNAAVLAARILAVAGLPGGAAPAYARQTDRRVGRRAVRRQTGSTVARRQEGRRGARRRTHARTSARRRRR